MSTPSTAPTPNVAIRNLFVLAYGQGTTQWGYRAPPLHTTSDFALPSYWAEAVNMCKPGDWLFTTHTAHGNRTYNSISAFTTGPSGLYAQSFISSFPTPGA